MVQNRNIALCIVLSIVTCGIYGLYWFVCLTDDTNTVVGEANGTSGVLALVLTIVTCNIYGLYWAYKLGEKLDTAKQQRGIPSSNSGILYLILCFFGLGIITYAIAQSELNKFAPQQ